MSEMAALPTYEQDIDFIVEMLLSNCHATYMALVSKWGRPTMIAHYEVIRFFINSNNWKKLNVNVVGADAFRFRMYTCEMGGVGVRMNVSINYITDKIKDVKIDVLIISSVFNSRRLSTAMAQRISREESLVDPRTAYRSACKFSELEFRNIEKEFIECKRDNIYHSW